MASSQEIERLKRVLRADISRFCRPALGSIRAPIASVLDRLKQLKTGAVFFGGTPRSLLVSRISSNQLGTPRDIDIVVHGASIDCLRDHLASYIERETRFGGLKLQHGTWQFDVWPLDQTWALKVRHVRWPGFSDLPRTTVFNLEAVAVDAWTAPGQPRRIYSGDDQFFHGVLNKLLELNDAANPFPELTVVRALVLARSLAYRIGPRLASYIARQGSDLTPETLTSIQREHYGRERCDGGRLAQWIAYVGCVAARNPEAPVCLPVERQRDLWSDETRVSDWPRAQSDHLSWSSW
jgi:hypothetical protein